MRQRSWDQLRMIHQDVEIALDSAINTVKNGKIDAHMGGRSRILPEKVKATMMTTCWTHSRGTRAAGWHWACRLYSAQESRRQLRSYRSLIVLHYRMPKYSTVHILWGEQWEPEVQQSREEPRTSEITENGGTVKIRGAIWEPKVMRTSSPVYNGYTS